MKAQRCPLKFIGHANIQYFDVTAIKVHVNMHDNLYLAIMHCCLLQLIDTKLI